MTDNDSYYEICIALDSAICAEVKDIIASEIADFTNEGLEFAESGAIIIRTNKNTEFINALLAHLQGVCNDLSAINNQNITFSHTIEIKQNRDWIAEYKRSIKPLRCGKFYIYPPWDSGNSSLGASFALGGNFEHSQTISLASRSKFSPNPKSPPQSVGFASEAKQPILEFGDLNQGNSNDSTESSLRDSALCAESWQSTYFCDSKNDSNKSARSATERSVVGGGGGSCEGGARGATSQFKPPPPPSKETRDRRLGEFKADLSARERKIIDLSESQKLQFLDSSPTAQNDNFMDCFGNFSPQDEFAIEFATINILLEPSLAFGTGHHSSTFMCIEAIQALHAQDSLKNKKVLDFGCGSGILALCAEKLGAVVDLCDIDESAIVESKKNFNNNNATISHIWQGGIADRIATHKNGVSSAKGEIYDIILANIIASVLIEQKDNIALSLKRGGIAVLSGILDIYKDEVLARFSDFAPLAICQSDEWICAVLQKV